MPRWQSASHRPTCLVVCYLDKRSLLLAPISVLASFLPIWKVENSPGWCGSVDWASSCEPKGRWFHSQSGHMPGLWARSPVGGACLRQLHIDVSLNLFLPPFPSKNKFKKCKKIKATHSRFQRQALNCYLTPWRQMWRIPIIPHKLGYYTVFLFL